MEIDRQSSACLSTLLYSLYTQAIRERWLFSLCRPQRFLENPSHCPRLIPFTFLWAFYALTPPSCCPCVPSDACGGCCKSHIRLGILRLLRYARR